MHKNHCMQSDLFGLNVFARFLIVALAGNDFLTGNNYSLVPSKYIKFINNDENIDYDTKMKQLQTELTDLLKEEEQSKADLLAVFKELGYEIKL